ncbi:hypothetical protein [Lysobacter claricitrinus]|uniref:hypothetical protein n=1 Tax=Lysobacter claricitrinus TaxID=3367728 RepID=UPI0037DBDF1C
MRKWWVSIVVVLALALGTYWALQAKHRHDQAAFVASQRAQAGKVAVNVDAGERVLAARIAGERMQRVALADADVVLVHTLSASRSPDHRAHALLTVQGKDGMVSLPYYGIDAWRVVQQLVPLLPGMDAGVAATQLSRFERDGDVACVLWASPAQAGTLEKAGKAAGQCSDEASR